MLCVDEKTQIQALDRTQPVFPMLPGTPARASHDYVRHGTSSLYAALDVATGKVIGSLHSRHRAVEFGKFLRKIDDVVPPGLDIHLVLDNLHPQDTRDQAVAGTRIRGSTCTSPRPARPGSTSSNAGSPN